MKKLENVIFNEFDNSYFDLVHIFDEKYVVYIHTSAREKCREFVQEEV